MAESGLLAVDGGRIYYEVEGDGHPLLLIHGGLGSLRMWDDQVPVFAERYRVIRYDTRGFGRTETEDVEFTNRADAAAVLDHVAAASAYVVGQSRGGMIALDLTPDHPERVDAGLRRKVHDWIRSTYQAEKAEGKPQPLDPPAAQRLAEVRVPTW